MTPISLLAQSNAEVALPTTLTATVVLVASLLITIVWLLYLYR